MITDRYMAGSIVLSLNVNTQKDFMKSLNLGGEKDNTHQKPGAGTEVVLTTQHLMEAALKTKASVTPAEVARLIRCIFCHLIDALSF